MRPAVTRAPATAAAAPLTRLSEDERMLRDSVRAFAEAEIAPLARRMDAEARMPRALIDRLFDQIGRAHV